ncbi:TetR/AcrR family transcriptional regulator [Naasia lichenicola]|uniref:TetR/AcrR family transcriptional regulator n=1 Tax=Naasia lichenicola TaxID=2565933 RepID=A0A4S4FRJ5_9MICO|nr:TetR/AcrR family transcriptional regulator [Naasia lichenicola]THG33273.1 TetR/AcrR family transcriptional regulator [Naasia lichenicola]
MPREVDAEQRLADIADATVRVARATGAQSITIRSVARELGGSTTLVTNYLPTRAALISNALDHARDRWRGERDQAGQEAPADPLGALLESVLTSTNDDPVLRTLILEIAANAPVEPELREGLRRESTLFQDELADAAGESGHPDARRSGQIAYLLLRGAIIATAEDPQLWNEAHLRDLIIGAVAALGHASSAQ